MRTARELEAHGLATLSEVWQSRVLVGFGITCRCHNNRDDKPGTICKKQILLGNPPITHTEAKLRLRRWYVAGAQGTWDPPTARSSHVNFGGRGLRMLDSGAVAWRGISENELNDIARGIGPSASGRGNG